MKITLTILLLCFTYFCFSQSLTGNLVNNPDFETFVVCPNSVGFDITAAANWDGANLNYSPDIYPYYFNGCTNGIGGVPNNLFGHKPHDQMVYPWTNILQEGYAAIVTYEEGKPNSRTHLTGDFINNTQAFLQSGTKYYFSARVARADNIAYTTRLSLKLSVPDIGFMQNYVSTDSNFEIRSAPISGYVWQTWSDSFVASQDYRGFAIGNFEKDGSQSLTDLIRRIDTIVSIDTIIYDTVLNTLHAVYYIDNFCISKFPNVCDGDNTIITKSDVKHERIDPLLTVYPNPAEDHVVILSDRTVSEVRISTVQGILVKDQKCNSRRVELNVSDLVAGLYFVKIRNDKGYAVKKLLIK